MRSGRLDTLIMGDVTRDQFQAARFLTGEIGGQGVVDVLMIVGPLPRSRFRQWRQIGTAWPGDFRSVA